MITPLDLFPSSKIILTEDIVIKNLCVHEVSTETSKKFRNSVTLPRGLVLTVSSVHMNQFYRRIKFKVVRAKEVVKEYYYINEIGSEFYKPELYNGSAQEFTHVRFCLQDTQLSDFLNSGAILPFTERYKELTKYEKQ